MRVVYTIAGLYRPAGMERIVSAKASALAELGHEVIIVTTEQKGRPNAFPLHPAVRTRDLAIGYEDNNGASFLSKALRHPAKVRRHRRALSALLTELRPDIVVSLFCGDERFLPSFKDGSAKVLEVHFSRFKRLQYGRHGLWALSDRIRSRRDLSCAGRFDRFVTLTREDLGYWGNPAGGVVIPNFLPAFPANPSALSARTVLAVGRYTYQKSFDRLIRAWAAAEVPDGWKLRIVGDGEEREALSELAGELGVGGTVLLDGPCADMDAVYREASVLALSSRYEGLPMVLLEAQAYGIPAVAFDCQCGPSDVISDGESGLLVPQGDILGLAQALETLMSNEPLRRKMGAAALAESRRWDRDTVMKQWTSLFEDILSSRR